MKNKNNLTYENVSKYHWLCLYINPNSIDIGFYSCVNRVHYDLTILFDSRDTSVGIIYVDGRATRR